MSHPELTPEQVEELKNRHIRSFVMRRGHITAAQQRATAELFPAFRIEYGKTPFCPESAFGRKAPLVLEIGCGMGETTAAIAEAHPEVDFLGCEVFLAGIGALSMLIHGKGLTNVRLIRHDAVEVVRDMLTEGSLDGVHIFFPDPWRKARHHKRRLVQPEFIRMLASRLKTGGYIHLATDWENYAGQMLEVMEGEGQLRNLHGEGFSPVMANPLCERPCTKFQARGLKLGHGIWDLVYLKE